MRMQRPPRFQKCRRSDLHFIGNRQMLIPEIYDYLISKVVTEVNARIERNDHLREYALKYVRWVIDSDEELTHKESDLFYICLPRIKAIFDIAPLKRFEAENGDPAAENFFFERIREVVMDTAARHIRYFRRSYHELKSIFLINYIDKGNVARLTSRGDFVIPAREREDVKALPSEEIKKQQFAKDAMTRIKKDPGRLK